MSPAGPRPPAPEAVDYDPFTQASLARVVPSTESQREIWLAAQLETGASLAYNESVSLRLRGSLDADALCAAVQALADRHEALRATLSASGEELCVAERGDLVCVLRDLASLDADARAAEIAASQRRAVETPFDLEHGPLLRAELLRVAEDDHLLLMTAHHIVCDGWSWGVIVRDLAALYARAELPAAMSFADFALAEVAHAGTDAHRADEAYWLARFATLPPALELPADHPRPRQRSFASQREDRGLDAELVAALRQFGAKRRTSLYATLLAAFGVLLHRLCGQDEVVIGLPAAGQAIGDHADLVGHCVNVLPLRVVLDPVSSFADLLARVRSDLLDAFEHQQYTFGTLLRRLALARDPARLPLAGVLFNLDQALDETSVTFPGLTFDLCGNPRTYENFELFINAVQVDGGLRLECQYNSDLFEGASVRRWLDAYETLLRAAISEPDTGLGRLPLVSAAERAAITRLQPARRARESGVLIGDLFAAQAQRAPQRRALRCGATHWTYADLAARSRRIGASLRQRGIGAGALVGICLERGPDMLASLLGVLDAGAAYVPLDPAYPRDRLNFMAEDAGLALLVNQASTRAALDWPDERTLSLDAESALASVTDADALPRVRLDAEAPAYVIYTSGSTGKPKGVCVPHRAVVNFLASMQHEPGIGEDDRLLAITTLSFDIAVLELLLPLCVGAEIVLATREQALDGHALAELLEASAATMMQATPATWRMLLETSWQGPPGFRALCGGEALAPDLAARLLPRVGALWNMYGPTETTVWSTCEPVREPARISIGRPIDNTTVWVLDAHAQPCPIGVPGELCIGGAGVTLGYLGRAELTAERFIADPFAAQPGARLYRTGDRGRWTHAGVLEHLGRLDFQVKLRGYRIELGEIEACLLAHAGVARALAIVREDRPGDMRLVAYLVAPAASATDTAALRQHLRASLPDYMLPQHFVTLDAIPLLPNGKVDRNALPAPVAAMVAAQVEAASVAHVAPRDDIERRVAAVMEQTLALPGIGIDDDFFALGGHSLLAAQLTARLNQEFGLALSLRTLFDTPSVAGLARTIAQAGSGAGDPQQAALPRIEPRKDQQRAPLSLLQTRLWLFDELNPGNVVYNTPSAHRLRGRLDEAAFSAAFDDLVERQASLRTSIESDGAEVIQRVHARVAVALFPAEDLSTLASTEREEELLRRLDGLTNTPFDLAIAPLFRVRMFRLAPEEHVLFFMPHHIIWDGWSFDLFYEEFSALYAARLQGQVASLPPLRVSYADFADWHGRWLQGEGYAGQFQRELDRWRELLARRGAPSPLPSDKPRHGRMSSAGETEWLTLPKALTDALRKVGRRADGTLFMALLAAYCALLWRVIGDGNLIVGTPVRVRASTDVEQVMGLFTNLLPLPIEVDPTLGFLALVARVRDVVLDSFASPDVQLEDLMHAPGMRELAGITHFYQAQFSYQDARERVCEWGGLRQQQVPLFQRNVSEDLAVWFLEHADGMIGGVLYNAELFHAQTARLLASRYVELLGRIIEDPAQSVAELTRPLAAEIEQLRRWNETASAAPPTSVHALFELEADRGADKTAFTAGSWGVRYSEIEQRANRIAACLQARGAGDGSVVGLCSSAGMNHLAGMLGILKVGATCVLLDPADSAERRADISADARVEIVLGDSQLPGMDAWSGERALWFDTDTSEILAASGERVSHSASPSADTPAFVVYVADPGEAPRGTGYTHAALTNLLSGMQRAIGLAPGDRVLGTAALASGQSIIECWLPLCFGAEMIQAGRAEAAGGEALAQLATASGASMLFASAAVWRSMPPSGWNGSQACKAVCVAGSLESDLAERLVTHCAGLWTSFGTDATAIVASCGRIEQPQQGIHHGVPLANTQVWVVDAHGHVCPIGALGELCVSGMSSGQPYGLRAEAAVDRSVPDADACASPGMAWLRTGVRGRWVASGQVEVLSAGTGSTPIAPAGEPAAAAPATPLGEDERWLAQIWCELLGVPQVRAGDNFLDLGGHSLLAVEMAARVQRERGVRLNLLNIATGTLGTLAHVLTAQRAADAARPGFGTRVLQAFGLR